MHGIIFLALEDFLEAQRGEGTWAHTMREANLAEQEFAPDHYYPDEAAANLFAASARVLGVPLAKTMEKLGIHMSPGLLTMGRSMGLIQEEWRTLDIVEHLPNTIFQAFKLDLSASDGVTSPNIRTYRPKYNEVSVAYLSQRKLCHLFKGIILGLGKALDEPIRFQERVCMLEQAPVCRLSVYLDDPVFQHQIAIDREFHAVQSRIQEVRHFNQFHGVPILNPGLVLHYSEKSVITQIHADSLLAMRSEGVTYLSLPHLPLGLKANISKVDMSHGTAHLHKITMTDGPIGHRLVSRVVPTKPINLELRLRRQTLSGWIANLSEGGVCMTLKRHVLLEETAIFTPIKLRFALLSQTDGTNRSLKIPHGKMVFDGNILNIEEKKDRHVVRIVFTPPPIHKRQAIQAYYKIQKQKAMLMLQEAHIT